MEYTTFSDNNLERILSHFSNQQIRKKIEDFYKNPDKFELGRLAKVLLMKQVFDTLRTHTTYNSKYYPHVEHAKEILRKIEEDVRNLDPERKGVFDYGLYNTDKYLNPLNKSSNSQGESIFDIVKKHVHFQIRKLTLIYKDDKTDAYINSEPEPMLLIKVEIQLPYRQQDLKYDGEMHVWEMEFELSLPEYNIDHYLVEK